MAIDLGTADSIQDVLDIVNNNPTLNGQGFAMAIAPSGQGLRVVSGPTANVTITTLNGASTAADLGIALDNQAIPALGAAVNPIVTKTTPLSALNGGGGVDTSQPLVINNGPYSASINLSGATTVQDVLNAINSANVRVKAEINDSKSGINVLNTLSGSSYSIVENSATGRVAQDLGILTTNLDTPLTDFKGRSGVDLRTGPDIRLSSRMERLTTSTWMARRPSET